MLLFGAYSVPNTHSLAIRTSPAIPEITGTRDQRGDIKMVNNWEEFECIETDDPVVDLDRLVDLLIEQYGLSSDYGESQAVERTTTH